MRGGNRPGSRLHGMAQEGLVPAVIQRAVVTAVDPDAYTMSVSTVVGKRHFEFMPIPSVYAHPFSAEGVHVMPDIGAELWIAVPSDGGSRAFPLLYQPSVNDLASMAGARPRLSPGDVVLQGREGNALRVRRGGVVEIESSPTCRTIFLPREGKIVSIAEATSLFTLGGSAEWYVGEPDELPSGDRVANFRARLKASATHKWSVIDIDAGGEFGASGLLTISTYESGDTENEADRTLLSTVSMGPSGVGVRLAAGKTLHVGGTGEGQAERVVMGETFLSDLSGALQELAAGLATFGIPTPTTTALVAQIQASLAARSGPFLSSFTETE